MANRTAPKQPNDNRSLLLRVSPETYLFPYKIQLFGHGRDCPIAFLVDGELEVPAMVLHG